MATVTFTQAEIDKFRTDMLNTAGVIEITIADRTTRLETSAEKQAFLAYMLRNADTGGQRTRFVSFSKGV